MNFSGTTGEETITIPFDLTSIISSENGTISPKTPLRVSVFIGDGNSEDDISVSYRLVKVVEPMSGETVDYTGGKISVLGWSDDVQYVDFQITAFIGKYKTQDITLEFNSDVHLEPIDESIYLTTSKNEIIYPDYEVIGNKIIVHCPDNGYDYNAKYELHITKDVISKGGNSLKNEIEVPIYIVTEVTNGIPLEME